MKAVSKDSKKVKKIERNVKSRGNLVFIIGITIFLLTVFILFGPTKTVTYQVEVSYTDTEHYTEKEPYETQEDYTVQEPYQTTEYYTDQVPVEQSVPYTDYDTVIHDAPSGSYYTDCGSCSCTKYTFWTGQCVQCTCRVAVTRYQTQIVYKDIQKERPVTKYQTVTKYRTVTQYRDVDKTREVIKIRLEERQMEVNWIWNFRMPYRLHLPYISEKNE
jgi:hypothetical protein